MLYIIEKSGVKRKAEEHNCKQCNRAFLRRVSGKQRFQEFCSPDCFNNFRGKKVKLSCYNCGKEINRTPSKMKVAKHGFYFCTRECKEMSQSLKGNCKEIQPSHYGTSEGREACRKLIAKMKTPKCWGCKEKRRYLLLVHHKDSNRDNNKQSNFRIVCWNCHICHHLKLIDGKWKYDAKFLTPENELRNIIGK